MPTRQAALLTRAWYAVNRDPIGGCQRYRPDPSGYLLGRYRVMPWQRGRSPHRIGLGRVFELSAPPLMYRWADAGTRF